jgi:hypothetical protein
MFEAPRVWPPSTLHAIRTVRFSVRVDTNAPAFPARCMKDPKMDFSTYTVVQPSIMDRDEKVQPFGAGTFSALKLEHTWFIGEYVPIQRSSIPMGFEGGKGAMSAGEGILNAAWKFGWTDWENGKRIWVTNFTEARM